MGKPKQRRKRAVRANNYDNIFGLNYFAESDSDVDLNGKDGWMMVKKQRVTILVPPLRVASKSLLLEPGPSPQRIMPSVTLNDESQCANKMVERMHSTKKLETSMMPGEKGADKASNVTSGRNITMAKPPNLNVRTELEHPDPVGPLRSHKLPGVSNRSKSVNRPMVSLGPKCLLGCGILNKRMRVSNLERKLQKAGGLNRWLISLGLGQFIKIFERKNVSKFEMVSLTMKKLKDMGASAVGPRRKLMHAIYCVY